MISLAVTHRIAKAIEDLRSSYEVDIEFFEKGISAPSTNWIFR